MRKLTGYICAFLLLSPIWVTGASGAQSRLSALESEEAAAVAAAVGRTNPGLETYRGHELRVRRNEQGALLSIGYKLFNDAMFQFGDSLALDFVERYFLMLDATVAQAERAQRLADDKVRITRGGEASIFRFGDAGISIDNKKIGGKPQVSVNATDAEGRTFASIEFPVNFELLTRRTRSELERGMPIMLKSASTEIQLPDKPRISDLEKEGEIYLDGGMNYYLESLTDRTYYRDADGWASAIFDNAEKQRSAANLLLGATEEQRRLELVQKLYGFKEQRISTNSGQWLNYCRDNDLKLYFSVEKEAEDGILALVIAENGTLMYNHLLSVLIPHDFVSNPKSALKGTLTAFIPTHNLEDLYEKREVFHKKDMSKIKNAE